MVYRTVIQFLSLIILLKLLIVINCISFCTFVVSISTELYSLSLRNFLFKEDIAIHDLMF